MSNSYKQKFELKPSVSLRTKVKLRFVLGGSALALAVIFSMGLFMYGNLGTSKNAKAADGTTLSSFSAMMIDGSTVTIQWSTETETNNAFFTVERSANAFDYETLGDVQGNGTSTDPHSYSYDDAHPLGGVSYYRLKQVNQDETFSYSAIQSINNESVGDTSGSSNPPPPPPSQTAEYSTTVTIEASANEVIMDTKSIDKESISSLSLFPIPATTEINVSVTFSHDFESHIDIVDLTGKVVYSQPVQFNGGQNTVKLPLNDLPKGIYFVHFADDNDKQVIQKFIKQ